MLERGTIVEGYRVDGVLGEGGMGTVYRATQLSLNRVVALKLLAAELSDDLGFRARFEREGQLQAGLDHQNIVTVYEAGQADQGLFLAMRLIDGPTLKDLILRGELDSRRALRILAQVAQALDEAHATGLIHRDIKPQNILIGKGDHTYLADFGLIKAPDDAALTGTGQFLGTIDYVAPEQIQGDPATAASDCYALCAVLFECLTGQVPFARANEAATLHAHVLAPPPRATEVRPDLPAAIDAVIASGMAKEPDERPASASELVRSAAGALAAMGPRLGQQTRLSPPGGDRSQSTRVPGAPGTRAPAGVLTAASAAQAPATGAAGQAAELAAPTRPSADALAPAHASRWPGARPVIALVIAAAAIVAGFLIGHAGEKTGAQTLSSSAAAGHLELRYPSRWQLGSAAGGAAVPGISFIDPIILTAPGRGGGSLAAGEVAGAAGPTLLPAAFRARLQGAPSPRQPVALNGLQALSYPDLHLARGAGSMTVYAIPTSAGVATIVCSGAGADFRSVCAQVAATLRLVNTTAFPLGPNPGYARGLSASLTRLRSSVQPAQTALDAARTPSAQAAAAARLALANTAAADRIGRLVVSPTDRSAHDQLLAALQQLAAGYSRAASAARGDHSPAYHAAGQQIAAASAALTRALQGVSALGYRVSSS